MIRFVGMTYILLLAGLVFGLYHVSYQTELLKEEAARVESEIVRARDDVAMLQAEWSARTAPDYLDELTEKFLPEMRPTTPEQIVPLSAVSERKARPQTDESIENLLALVELRETRPDSGPHL